MADPEKSEDGRSFAQKIREAIRNRIKGADAAGKKEITDEVKDDIKKVGQHSDQAYAAHLRNKFSEHRPEADQVLTTIIKAAEAVKAGVLTLSNSKAQVLLVEIADKIDTPQYATTIEKHLRDYLFGQKDITLSAEGATERSDFEKAFDWLKMVDPRAAELVAEAIEGKAGDLGITSEMARAKFKIEKPKEPSAEELREATEEASIAEGSPTWQQDYQNYYSTIKNKDDIELLKSLYHPREFIKYINRRTGKDIKDADEIKKIEDHKAELKVQIEEEQRKKKETLSEAELNKKVDQRLAEEVSKEISQKLINILDKIHVRLSRERPSEFYEEVAEKDFFHGIRVTIGAVQRAIEALGEQLKALEKDEKIDLKLYQYVQGEREILPVGIKGEETEKTFIRLRPLLTPKPVSLSQFAVHLELLLNYYTHGRRYLHNVGAILNLPADPQKGFYEGLKGYAEKLQGTDVDEILNMPDGDLVLEAYQLYEKFIEEQFAAQDWKHEPDQFSTKDGSPSSQVEEEIIKALQIAHPEIDDRDRLMSALYMGKGLARGAFLTEEEKASYADPPLTPSGGGTFASYYTTDATPLMVFNPSHMFIRWQGEANLYPWLFVPIDDPNLGKGIWDHEKVYQNILKYRESYWKGRGRLGKQRLLIDDLVDFGNVGGPSKRRGWRMLHFTKDYYVWETTGEKGKEKLIHRAGIPQAGVSEFNVLKTWQNIEKIGWEVIYDFITNNRIGDANKGFLDKAEYKDKRTEFFKYLYKTYFNKDEAGFDSYIDKLRSAERTDVLDGIKKGTVSPDNIGEAVEEATSKTFLNRMLARYIAKTFPSKFLRIDRDRFNEDGKSKWQKVRMALIKEELIKEELKWDPDKFDKVMKNLSLAESLLRQNVSKAMREQLKIVKEKEDFLGLDSINYELDAPKIRTLFAGKEISDGDLTDIIKVYDKINELYLNDAELDKFADSIGNEPEKFYTFTFGIEQTDLSFLLFKRAGPRTIPRAIGDIANMEQHMMNNGVLKLPEVLQQMAVGGGRGDFSPLVHVLKEVYDAYVMVHGAKDGYEAVHKLASAAIAYFKKDTMAKGILGLLTGSSARTNSIAAKVAGRGAAVWEWDATDIDKFVIALETNGLLKKDPYDLSLPGRYEPRYITPSKLPILNKIPFLDKIPLLNKSYKTPFTQRKVDYAYNGHSLREKFGGNWNHILQDFLLKYGPLFIAFLLYKFISESLKEAEGKKQ